MITDNGQRTTAKLCVPVCVRRADELRATVTRAAAVADIVELRLDCLADGAQLEAARAELPAIFAARTRPFILTFRSPEQGGRRALTERACVRFWQTCWRDWQAGAPRPDFVDIELDLLLAHGPQVWPAAEADAQTGARIDVNARPALICSHHDFAGIPADLAALYERMTRTPARVCKLAVAAHDATDCLALFQLLARARREGRAVVVVGMGAAGLATRVLAPAHGALLTYGALDADHATAPGQLAAQTLRDLYRVHALDARTAVYGLLGRPVAHSLSPHLHNAAFAARALNAVYVPFDVGDAPAFIRRLAHPRTRELDLNIRGLSVTAPHKQAVIPLLDSVDDAAREVGAVNTIVFDGDALRGHNTDAAAALAPLAAALELRGARVALLGAGGAARAVLWALRRAGAHTTVFARDEARARPVAAQFDAATSALHTTARFAGFDLVINATPLGTRGHAEDQTPADASQLRGPRAAYDLVYNPADTRFMREARAAGCAHVAGGFEMLVAQAAAQFELWTVQPAPLDAMRAAAERQMRAGDADQSGRGA
ncbi:MAG TPA: shikimate dehydrogenase [Pyrinomonadaceae bacterium]|jgi:3-dehydroquinate dehydratase/shikimate dehydrogenase